MYSFTIPDAFSGLIIMDVKLFLISQYSCDKNVSVPSWTYDGFDQQVFCRLSQTNKNKDFGLCEFVSGLKEDPKAPVVKRK